MGSARMGAEPPPGFPNQQMEIDAHQLDGIYDLSMDMGRYPPKSDTFKRPWLLVLLDRSTLVVWSYLIVLATQISQYDVLRLFKRFTAPWSLPELTHPYLKYIEGAGMPRDVLSGCDYMVADEIHTDNALAHISRESKRIVTQLYGGTLVAGPYRRPNRRPYIESFYGKIAETCHRLPNTTGSHPGDNRRKNPQAAAEKYQFNLSFLNQLIATIMANYNATNHPSLGNRSPLQALEHYLKQQPLRMLLDSDIVNDFNISKQVTVRGDRIHGRRPYVQYEHVRYSSSNLRDYPSLIGKKITLSIDYDGIEKVSAYLDDGQFFDFLTPMDNRWQYPHSLEERKLFFRYEGEGGQENIYHDLITKLPQSSRSAALQIPKTLKTAKVPIYSLLSHWNDDDGQTTYEG